MTIAASWAQKSGVRETLVTGVDAASTPTISCTAFDRSGTLTATSDVPATKQAFDSTALTTGAYTLDLTNTVGINGATVDMTGLKVQTFFLHNTGAARLTVAQGGSNPYNLGGTSFSQPLEAGQSMHLYGNDANPDVSSSAKNISITGTGTNTFNFQVVAG